MHITFNKIPNSKNSVMQITYKQPVAAAAVMIRIINMQKTKGIRTVRKHRVIRLLNY